MKNLIFTILLIFQLFPNSFAAFLLPGIEPHDYAKGDKVDLLVTKLSSTKVQLPYDYYRLPFCVNGRIIKYDESLGQILAGDVTKSTFYEIRVMESQTCTVLCKRTYTATELGKFKSKIDDEYTVNMLFDSLPLATVKYTDEQRANYYYHGGYSLGQKLDSGRHILNNHLHFTFKYHKNADSNETYRIVGAEVVALSVKHVESANGLSTCNEKSTLGTEQQTVDGTSDETIFWTYEITWLNEPDIEWASRWDLFFRGNPSEKVHWFAVVNSLLIVVFLSIMIGLILIRALHKDIDRYNTIDSESREEALEETGWKLIHGDVFRPPNASTFFAIIVGAGVQVAWLAFIILMFATFGFLSPARRGSILTALVLLFFFLGSFCGYYSARLSKIFNPKNWKKTVIFAAIWLPASISIAVFIINLFVWYAESSYAIPFKTIFSLLLMWIGINTPLVLVGAFLGFRRPKYDIPVKVNQISRIVPPQPWYLDPIICCLSSGLLPFGAVFMELFFILTSIWLHQIYYIFTFIFIVFVIMIITCAEVSIVVTYFQLSSEDYHWWWRSFFATASSAFYVFLYGMAYYTKLHMTKFTSKIFYFGYTLIISYLFFLVTGTAGFLASFYFVRTIYASIKVD